MDGLTEVLSQRTLQDDINWGRILFRLFCKAKIENMSLSSNLQLG